MSTTYIATADPNVVVKRDDQDIDLSAYIAQFLSLKQEYLDLPDFNKTVPDQETLDYWNSEMQLQWEGQAATIRYAASQLLDKVTPIRDAGLLPSQFEDEYLQLYNFVNQI